MRTIPQIDLAALARALTVLHDPYGYGSYRDWIGAASQAVQALGDPDLVAICDRLTRGAPGRSRPVTRSWRVRASRRPAAEVAAAVDVDHRVRDLLDQAIRQGLDTIRRAERQQLMLQRQLDAFDAPALMVDEHGQVVYRTARLATLMAGDASAPSIERMVQAAGLEERGTVRTMSATMRASTGGRVSCPGWSFDVVRHPALLGWRGDAIVVVARRDRVVLTDALLHDDFGLTRREVQVARALATSSDIAAIADSLGISAHTVRRHTEAVYRKLGVTTRRAMANRLAGVSD